MEPIKHDWYREADGSIDFWRLEYEYHNGPQCMRCGYSFCHHCYDELAALCDEQTPYLF